MPSSVNPYDEIPTVAPFFEDGDGDTGAMSGSFNEAAISTCLVSAGPGNRFTTPRYGSGSETGV
ncbi:hypothetical protein BGZ47_003259 [Haplosporangium gracile]|nr:hypothetical protein BGZ47_003259 [Haplosporangium gracile]